MTKPTDNSITGYMRALEREGNLSIANHQYYAGAASGLPSRQVLASATRRALEAAERARREEAKAEARKVTEARKEARAQRAAERAARFPLHPVSPSEPVT